MCSVTQQANSSRSIRRAFLAGTAVRRTQAIHNEPRRRGSALSNPKWLGLA
jgi:hypothetical protein